jgi:hypothetical protein
MDKKKRKYNAEGAFNPSPQLQPMDKTPNKSGEKDHAKLQKSTQFYTIDTIINLIDRIKRL